VLFEADLGLPAIVPSLSDSDLEARRLIDFSNEGIRILP